MELALYYAVLPIRKEGARLDVGIESDVDPVPLTATTWTPDRPVGQVMLPNGRITSGSGTANVVSAAPP